MFRIEVSSNSQKFIDKADRILKQRLLIKIEKLQGNPFPSEAKRVIGREEKLFRIRVGDYRVLYVVDYETQSILISDIDKRSTVYD